MEIISEFKDQDLTNNNNDLFEQFLKDNNDSFKYDEVFLSQLISQEDPTLLNTKVDNLTLMQQILDIQKNDQYPHIFHLDSFIQEAVEIDECNSNNDNNENIYNDQEELENSTNIRPDLCKDETHIMNEATNTIPFSPCVIIDTVNGKLQTCGNDSKKNISQLVGTWQIDTNFATEFLDEKVNLGICMSHFNYDQKNHADHAKQLRKTEHSIVH